MPTPEWRAQDLHEEDGSVLRRVDRHWKSGYSIQLAIGQGDLQVTPLQMARFYAMLANGGQLVTPHLVEDVEQPGSGSGPGAQPLVLRSFRPPREGAEPRPAALRSCARACTRRRTRRSARRRPSSALPDRDRGQDGHGREGRQRPARRRLTSWWCGYGPFEAPRLVVCAVIENGGFGGEAAAPSALQVFENFFGQKAASVTPASTD